MNLLAFKELIDDLNNEIKDAYSDHENEVYPIYDGVFNFQEYFVPDNLKVLWLMKEAYESAEREGGWSYPDFYADDYDRFYWDLVRGNSRSTWQPIVYSSFGIHNDCLLWDDISDIEKDPEIVKILGKIALINIQKLPSQTGSRTDMTYIHQAYAKHKEILLRQIELLNPDVVICANVFHVIKNDFQFLDSGSLNSVDYYCTDKTLFIDAYHPAQTTVSRENYVNDIINCYKSYNQLRLI